MSKKKKIRRFRGSRTCGEGKDHRGHGDRGGRGLAGSGKRASHKLSYFQNYNITLGKRGFASYKRRKIVKTINLASKLEITKIYREYRGDAFFPYIDPQKWKEVFREDHKDYSFVTFEIK